MAKQDDVTPEHLDWLNESRRRILRSATDLRRLMDEHKTSLQQVMYRNVSEALVAICFSLWRAAFLADKTGEREAVFEDARLFLGKIIVDNAIAFTQDRIHREWTFNYYVSNAENRLWFLSKKPGTFNGLYAGKPSGQEAKPMPQRRWDACQSALEGALSRLSQALDGK